MNVAHDVGSGLPYGGALPLASDAESLKLAARIKRLVRRRTGGAVQDLDVDVLGHRATLTGRCSTFYCKQLAQHAAMEIAEDFKIDNQIEVGQLKR